MAKAVDKPLHVDMATKNKSRAGYAKIKVKVNLLREISKRINVGVKKIGSGKIMFTWIKIRYDYMKKYCKACKLQGHKEAECFVIHPQLKIQKEDMMVDNNQQMDERTLANEKIVGPQYQGEEQVPVMENKEKEILYKEKGRQHRNDTKKIWNASKDMRVFTPNKGMKPQKEKSNNNVKEIQT